MTTQKKQISIEIDSYQDIYVDKVNGKYVPKIHQSIFFSDSESANIDIDTPLEELLNKFICLNSIPTGYVTEAQKEELLNQMDSILEVVIRQKEFVENIEIIKPA